VYFCGAGGRAEGNGDRAGGSGVCGGLSESEVFAGSVFGMVGGSEGEVVLEIVSQVHIPFITLLSF